MESSLREGAYVMSYSTKTNGVAYFSDPGHQLKMKILLIKIILIKISIFAFMTILLLTLHHAYNTHMCIVRELGCAYQQYTSWC